jgi:methyl-accepting chemotaxis protein
MKGLQRQLFLINALVSVFTLALTGGSSMWVLRLVPEEKSAALGLALVLYGIGCIVHVMMVRPLVPQMNWRPGDEAAAALASMRSFPIRAARTAWYLWLALDVAGCLFFYILFGRWEFGERSMIITLLLFGSVLSGGGIGFLMQYYAYKQLLMAPMRRAAADLPERSALDTIYDVPAYGLRNKLIVSSLTLLAGSLLFSVVFGYTRIAEGTQARLAARAEGVMQRLRPEIERGIEGSEWGPLAERFKDTELGSGGQLYLIDDHGEDVLKTNAAAIPLARLAAETELNWRAAYVVRALRVEGGKYTVLAVFPWDLGRGDMSQAGKAFGWLFFFVSVITIAVGTFSAREIAAPVKEIVYRAERIARGELNEPLEILSEDDVGEFSADLEEVRRFLRSILNDVDEASRQIEALSSRVLMSAQALALSSGEQSTRLSAGQHAVQRMTQGFDRISRGSVDLTMRAGEGGGAILQLDGAVKDVDGGTDRIVGRVDSVREGIDKMNRVSELIFANLGDLSRSMDVTVRNIRKFSDSIRRNEERVGSARALSMRVLESSAEGLDLTRQTGDSVRAIDKSVEGIAVILDDLIARLNDVGKLIGVIDEVADDTKLLSLNAAIIAAQAGARGRSFSVLAEKIKVLADRTNTATGQIIDMIEQVGDGSHQLAAGMERVRQTVGVTRQVAHEAGERLSAIIETAQSGVNGMAAVAGGAAKHVEEGQNVERSVVGLANAVEQIHASVRGQRSKAAEVSAAMERVETGVRTLKSAARAQAEGGRVLSGSIDQVTTMVTHLKKILHEQQTEMHRVQDAIRAIGEGAAANQAVSRKLQTQVESLRSEAEVFHRFVERFKIA